MRYLIRASHIITNYTNYKFMSFSGCRQGRAAELESEISKIIHWFQLHTFGQSFSSSKIFLLIRISENLTYAVQLVLTQVLIGCEIVVGNIKLWWTLVTIKAKVFIGRLVVRLKKLIGRLVVRRKRKFCFKDYKCSKFYKIPFQINLIATGDFIMINCKLIKKPSVKRKYPLSNFLLYIHRKNMFSFIRTDHLSYHMFACTFRNFTKVCTFDP